MSYIPIIFLISGVLGSLRKGPNRSRKVLGAKRVLQDVEGLQFRALYTVGIRVLSKPISNAAKTHQGHASAYAVLVKARDSWLQP